MAKIKAADAKYVGGEPVWDTDRAASLPDSEFKVFLIEALNFYNYQYSTKDLRKHLDKWLTEQAATDSEMFTKPMVQEYKKTSDSLTPVTACSLVCAHNRGMPLKSEHVEYIHRVVSSALRRSDHAQDPENLDEPAQPKKRSTRPQPTIQDRMNEIANQHILHFDLLEDQVISGKKVDPAAFDYMKANTVPSPVAGKVAAVFQTRLDEFAAVQEGSDDQLREGYSHLRAADVRRFIKFYQDILDAIEQYRSVRKAVKKPRAKKAPAKDKLVARLKYLKESPQYKIASVDPTKIIGAQKLWVYNVKTRKLGCYQANEVGPGLGVKGASITDYDPVSSVQKTLRKPDQQLKEFTKAGKVALRKFLGGIKSVEIKLNGRINADTVLLKVE